uniref:M56 family metallopeptidase n=1 Tax=uncultured Sphingomonas sp. TaxID=158754 RepID=UPI0025DA5600|nr:M56 family metallopeptidase [uncultured Sphingomonas sp.]
MELLIPFALKSLLIAGLTLGALQLMRSRSAAERSMVAHLGLLALLMVPLGPMLLPQLVVQVPVASTAQEVAPVASATAPSTVAIPAGVGAPATEAFDPLSLWPLAYGFPVALLLAVTLLAVVRLLALRAKASVLVDPSWLTALARAQRRMGFKHGTALLTSSELKSPISWGLLRPVILLNDGALEARHQAEAIIAHELAHVRGFDWAKLLLARAVTAVFWFNPLVWILAREAHQLREETADDAVLAAQVASHDYAQLLVGVARHDCNGLLLGAHGVAPAKGSLSRRVRRVLDTGLRRGPAARGFAVGVALGAVATAAPLAALTFTPDAAPDVAESYQVAAAAPEQSLPLLVAQSVAGATALTSQVVSAQVAAALTGKPTDWTGEQLTANRVQRVAGLTRHRTDEVQRLADRARQEADQVQRLASHPHEPAPARPGERRPAAETQARSEIDGVIAAKALGITPSYAARIRAAAPGVRIDNHDLVGMRAVGITPQWLSDMTRAGYRAQHAGDLTGAKAVGVTGAYVADLAAAGYRNVPLGELTAMRAMGVTGRYVRNLRAAGVTGLSTNKLIELRAHGISAATLRGVGEDWPHGMVEPPEPPELVEPEHDNDHGE